MFKAKKKFGQNFLKDEAILSQIIQAIPKNRHIVEIGAGLGDLTQRLLSIGRVRAYEIDCDLIPILRSRFADELSSGVLTLINADILDSWQGRNLLDREYDMVANLPYYVATNIVLKALGDENCKSLTVMVQREVAHKFCAQSGESEFGAISVLSGLNATARVLFDVPPSAFEPAPKVTSSVMQICKTAPLISQNGERGVFANFSEYEDFARFLRTCFGSPRKTLARNLAQIWTKEQIEAKFSALNLPRTIRPHELDVALFLEIYRG